MTILCLVPPLEWDVAESGRQPDDGEKTNTAPGSTYARCCCSPNPPIMVYLPAAWPGSSDTS